MTPNISDRVFCTSHATTSFFAAVSPKPSGGTVDAGRGRKGPYSQVSPNTMSRDKNAKEHDLIVFTECGVMLCPPDAIGTLPVVRREPRICTQ
ncbi:uncharacterized protein LOC133403833 isoform X2 [Phycodurus eques]|uniref:uncharacterized protein LOC133403833 isoform X2 n=1 Tax=Phycodurus eques TaxID=693459 RepID=UPI002ACEA42F|nr:uncharacterized protein LOC133403833 isoform X2 [Phycodurus eques]